MTSRLRPTSTVFRDALAQPLMRHGVRLDDLADGVAPDAPTVRFYRAFSQARRRMGEAARGPFAFEASEVAAMADLYPGFEPTTWPLLTTARVWLLHLVPADQALGTLGKLLRHADIGEQVAIYRGLYTLDDPTVFAAEVAEGVRTNMVDVFDAVALHNPIAPWLLDDVGWTQLALKAVFMGRPLYRILDLDARRTPALAQAAHEYAHERWSAGRTIHPELWRLLADTKIESEQATLRRARADDDPLTARAASWALGQRDATLWPDALLPENDAAAWLAIGVEAEARAAAASTRDVLYPSPKPPAQDPS